VRQLLHDYVEGRLSRRGFLRRLAAAGFTAAAARSIVEAADLDTQTPAPNHPFKVVTGSGGDLLVEQALAAGAQFVFTNPGSFEVGFFDALTDRPGMQVIVGLHEGIVIPMADGYHKVSRQPAFVNVHAIGGTAQMAGQLNNAHRDGSAIVVTAGLLDSSTYSDEVRLSPRPGFSQSDVNRQFTKISWEIRNGASIPVATRRAFKTAAMAPGGPVYICYSSAALETQNLTGDVWPRDKILIEARPRPAADQVERVAKALIESERPLAIFGDEIWKSGAQAEALELVEMLGLPASTDFYSQAFCNFPLHHAQYVGLFAHDLPYPGGHPDLIAQFGANDIGGSPLPQKPLIDPSTKVIAAGIDGSTIGRTEIVDMPIVADVRETLRDVIAAVTASATADRLKKIRDGRLATVTPYVSNLRAAADKNAASHFNDRPIHPERLGREIDQAIDPDAIVVSENLSAGNTFFRLGFRPGEKMWLTNSGHSLGWGVGAAIGAKLAAPDRQVVLSIGDGSMMYSAAGFWSMARYEVPILMVVWNNSNYQQVRAAYARYGRRMATTGHYHGMFLGDPDIDFVKLAGSQGVGGEKVTDPDAIKAALKRGVQATAAGSSYLVDVVIGRVGAGADSTWHQKFSLAKRRTKMV
jgi:thiamine pyrophosphate-dependent acetolactate synthase large subunit-like protein